MDFGGLRGPRQTDSRGGVLVVDGKRPWTIGVAKGELCSFYNPLVGGAWGCLGFLVRGGTQK